MYLSPEVNAFVGTDFLYQLSLEIGRLKDVSVITVHQVPRNQIFEAINCNYAKFQTASSSPTLLRLLQLHNFGGKRFLSIETRSEFALKLRLRENKKLHKKGNVFENIFNK